MSSVDDTLKKINTAIIVIIFTVSFINLVLGAIGLVFNVFIFTRQRLRHESCSLYFFSATCFNLFVIFVIVPVRITSEGFNIEIGNYNIGICKIEFFAFYVVRAISCWLIVLACVDRYLKSSASVRLRQLSSYKTARIAILITIITLIILHLHMPVYYELINMPDGFGNIIPQCYGQKGFYRTFIAFWSMVLYSLCPSFFMLLFGFLTLHNIHQHRKIRPRIVSRNDQTNRRVDKQLIRMLAAQVLVIILSTLPFSIYRLYASLTVSVSKDTVRLAWENLAFKTASVLTYFAHSTSFYLYTLTGTVFREEFYKIIRKHRQLNSIIPTNTVLKMYPMSSIPGNQRPTIIHPRNDTKN